jgi:hypothetical protein
MMDMASPWGQSQEAPGIACWLRTGWALGSKVSAIFGCARTAVIQAQIDEITATPAFQEWAALADFPRIDQIWGPRALRLPNFCGLLDIDTIL